MNQENEEKKEIDQEISHIFSNERYYILTDIDENIGIYSKQLEMYHNYEERYLED